jgi:GTPase
MVHCGVVRQNARVMKLEQELMRTGDKAVVSFRFMYQPEWITTGETVLFREGRTKGLGRITAVRCPVKVAET